MKSELECRHEKALVLSKLQLERLLRNYRLFHQQGMARHVERISGRGQLAPRVVELGSKSNTRFGLGTDLCAQFLENLPRAGT